MFEKHMFTCICEVCVCVCVEGGGEGGTCVRVRKMQKETNVWRNVHKGEQSVRNNTWVTKGLRILSIVRKLHITRFDGLCYNVKLHLQLLVAYVTSKGGATIKIDLGMRHNRRKVVWE